MQPVRRAVIDVGTNSIKLLVADVSGHEVRPVWEESQQTRLGRGFYESHRLQPEAIAATAEAAARFAALARERQAVSIRLIATSAAREAANAGDLTAALERASGLQVEIISGDIEAAWTIQGATSDPALAQTLLLLLDVGGGSTEFVLGQGTQRHFAQSFPLGSVRLLEQIAPGDPPQPAELAACRQYLRDFLRERVAPSLGPALESRTNTQAGGSAVRLIGTGGTASILGCMEARLTTFDRARLEATRLSLGQVRSHATRLWGLPLAERKKTIGLPPNRADVILTGVAIYEAVMEQFGFSELGVTTRGLRFAAVMDA
jgi:exopolyphosphatase/guanosine-5'-triphosphate,3'-diphosphate pyrophosphatase